MVTPTYTITCTKKVLLAPGVYELRFTRPENFMFKAGQFVLFDVPLIDNPSDIQPRALSIASTLDEQELIFVVKMLTGGRMSRWIEEVVTEGLTATMKGPFGLFTLKPDQPKGFLMVATGAGVAPFRSQLKWLLEEQKDTRPLHLVFGARLKGDLFWTDQFEALEKAHPNFHFHISLSGEQDWHGHRGRVQMIIPQIISDFSQIKLYVCGAPPMVADIKKHAMEDWKLAKADVHGEGYM